MGIWWTKRPPKTPIGATTGLLCGFREIMFKSLWQSAWPIVRAGLVCQAASGPYRCSQGLYKLPSKQTK